MQHLVNSDFSWHIDEPDLPQKTADEMKEFLDAPIHTLVSAFNIMADEVNDNAADIETLDGELQATIAEETSVRQAADNTLGNLIDTESDERAISDAAIRTELQEESTARAAADTALQQAVNGKQNILTAGENISIDGNVISAEFPAYEFTDGEDISESLYNEILAIVQNGQSVIVSSEDMCKPYISFPYVDEIGQIYFCNSTCENDENAEPQSYSELWMIEILGDDPFVGRTVYSRKDTQKKLIAGTNITIEDNVISATGGGTVKTINGYGPDSSGAVSLSSLKIGYTPGGVSVEAAITDLYSRKIVKTAMDSIAVPNACYYLGTQSAVTVSMPSTANIGDEIVVCFTSGATACTLTVDLVGFDFVPKANKTSWLKFTKYSANDWLVETKED